MALGWELVSLPFVFYRDLPARAEIRAVVASRSSTWAAGSPEGARARASLLTIVGRPRRLCRDPRWRGISWWVVTAGAVRRRRRPAVADRAGPADAALLPLPSARSRSAARAADDAVAAAPACRSSARSSGGLARRRPARMRRWSASATTRRILVSDTLLKDYTDDEIEVILAHEMAHHIHHDIWTALALETLDRGGRAVRRRTPPSTRFGGTAGPGGAAASARCPLLILAAGVVSLLLTPLGNAWSRAQRAPRRSLRADADRPPGRLHLGDAPPRRSRTSPRSARRPPSSGSSTRTRPSTSASRRRRVQGRVGPDHGSISREPRSR